MTRDQPNPDCLVVGGGVAGLWCRWALEKTGRSVVLAEARALGAGQTIASQGILHRGVKYALSPSAAAAMGTLERTIETWEAAMSRRAGPDLSSVRVISPVMHLWTTGVAERLAGFGASMALRSSVRAIERSGWPPAFASADRTTRVWEVDEKVIDAASLLDALARAGRGPLIRARVSLAADGGVTLEGEESTARLRPRVVVLAAGEANAALLARGGPGGPGVMQRRPLHMVMVRGVASPLFAHCLRANSDKPRVTITTGADSDGRLVWYLGGGLAEDGVAREAAEQIAAAKAELARRLGGVGFGGLEWASFLIDRAEGSTPDGKRPDGPVVRAFGNVIAAWPTKLALAPVLADLVASQAMQIHPHPGGGTPAIAGEWSRPPVAPHPWAEESLRWTS